MFGSATSTVGFFLFFLGKNFSKLWDQHFTCISESTDYGTDIDMSGKDTLDRVQYYITHFRKESRIILFLYCKLNNLSGYQNYFKRYIDFIFRNGKKTTQEEK